jgi:GNAT superfamily N-acetyltransferase
MWRANVSLRAVFGPRRRFDEFVRIGMSGFTVRRLGPDDEAVLVEAAHRMLEREWPAPRCASALADPAFVAVIAVRAGEPIGLAYGYVLDRLHRRDLLLYSIDVDEPHRRRGAARAMVEALKALCLDEGLGEKWVLTNASNEAAMRLYAGAGGVREFDDVEMFAYPTPGQPQDD